MKKIVYFILLVFAASCSSSHLINEKSKRKAIKENFEAKKELLRNDTSLFHIFDKKLTNEQREALEFLYAYSPLTDMSHSGEFFLDQVNATLDAKKKMSWAKDIPDDIFLHFVIPLRVNNENLDSSRVVFYEELRDRVDGLSMYDAALEVNHFCHEKVTYTPSDARTSSPLASCKSAYGRCGEESVFTVAALRAVGIPARQVYTPRWAHSDDNHAWVEVYIDGKWYYMGACEPDVELNMGWFTPAALRSMLMHTKVFGDYSGNEEVMDKSATFTEINVTENYAPVKEVEVKVVDREGNAVEDAKVEFRVYNYAEFFPVATKKTDVSGKTMISLGKGDIVVWVTKAGNIGFDKLSVLDQDSITIVLDKMVDDNYSISYDITPPAEGAVANKVDEELKKVNDARLQQENAMRQSYVDSFIKEDKARDLAVRLGVDSDKFWSFIDGSRGNYDQIIKFVEQVSPNERGDAMQLLAQISAKDLRDTPSDVLISHFNSVIGYKTFYENDIFNAYILSPRVDTELLTPYAEYFISNIQAKADIAFLLSLLDNVKVEDSYNAASAPISPLTAWRLKVSDKRSKEILFVAASRSMGIPARLESTTLKPQYYNGNQWVDVNIVSGNENSDTPQGTVKLRTVKSELADAPKYGTHYTIAKIGDDNRPQTVKLYDRRSLDMGDSKKIDEPIVLDSGKYMLTTGTRLADGRVLNKVTFFNVDEGKQTIVDVVLREDKGEVSVIGNINPEAKILSIKDRKSLSLLDITGRGYYVLAFIDPKKEPTNHAMRDLAKISQKLNRWSGETIVVFKDEKSYGNFDAKEFKGLPEISYVIDDNNEISEMLSAFGANVNNLPVFIVADSFGRVVFKSEGYSIGLAEKLLGVISRL